MDNQTERFCLLVKGQVQGVGFRPWIFRTAKLWPLTGFVRNDTAGVIIEVQGKRSDIQQFISAIRDSKDAPPLSHITEIESETVPVIPQESSFVIDHSNSAGQVSVSVTPDTAVCQECLDEMHDESDFRYNYPFINCTNCGPRYTIIKSIPYDRPNTTMSDFAMCKRCSSQYTDGSERSTLNSLAKMLWKSLPRREQTESSSLGPASKRRRNACSCSGERGSCDSLPRRSSRPAKPSWL